MVTRQIRPPDPAFAGGIPPRTGQYSSAEAVRLLAHCFFRDAWTALDLTFAAGNFWRLGLPPGLMLTSNNIDQSAQTDLHLDFTSTGLPDESFDLVVYDPPHLADLGEKAFMRRRYGTVKNDDFRATIEDGAREAWRIARVGVIVKVVDGPHRWRYQQLSRWIERVIPLPPVFEMHTIGRPSPRPAGEVGRVPRGNDATWLAFRRDGLDGRYPDFVKLYERQLTAERRSADDGQAR